MKKDYYRILNVEKNASPEEIKASFRKLARTYHPDVSGGPETEEIFKDIREAYEVLTDRVKRVQYDRFRRFEDFFMKMSGKESGRSMWAYMKSSVFYSLLNK